MRRTDAGLQHTCSVTVLYSAGIGMRRTDAGLTQTRSSTVLYSAGMVSQRSLAGLHADALLDRLVFGRDRLAALARGLAADLAGLGSVSAGIVSQRLAGGLDADALLTRPVDRRDPDVSAALLFTGGHTGTGGHGIGGHGSCGATKPLPAAAGQHVVGAQS